MYQDVSAAGHSGCGAYLSNTPPHGTPFSMPPSMSQSVQMPQSQSAMMGGPPPLAGMNQYMPNVTRPQMTAVANPPIVAGNIPYGPSYKMQYQRRSTCDKTAVKY